jgi:hypothetical protein
MQTGMYGGRCSLLTREEHRRYVAMMLQNQNMGVLRFTDQNDEYKVVAGAHTRARTRDSDNA